MKGCSDGTRGSRSRAGRSLGCGAGDSRTAQYFSSGCSATARSPRSSGNSPRSRSPCSSPQWNGTKTMPRNSPGLRWTGSLRTPRRLATSACCRPRGQLGRVVGVDLHERAGLAGHQLGRPAGAGQGVPVGVEAARVEDHRELMVVGLTRRAVRPGEEPRPAVGRREAIDPGRAARYRGDPRAGKATRRGDPDGASWRSGRPCHMDVRRSAR